MTSRESDADELQAEIEAFRREAARLGFEDDGVDPLELESADEFIARMKANDAPERSPWRRRLPALAAAAAVAVVAVGIGIDRPGGTAAVADTPPILDFEFASAVRIAYAGGEDSTDVLILLADAAGAASEDVGQGRYQYKQSDNWFIEIDDDGSSEIVPRVREAWLAPDGSLATQESAGRPLSADGRGVRPEPTSTTRVDEVLPEGTVDADYASSLSRDPDTLVGQMLEHIECEEPAPGPGRAQCLFQEVTALFQTYVVPPDLARAVWSALSQESGFVTLGSVEDRAGRDGVGIALEESDRPEFRNILIASLDDGQMLGTEELVVRPLESLDVDPPAVVAFSTITVSSRVATVPPNTTGP